VVFVAHYDCTPNSPGANDNASGVFTLLAAACRLRNMNMRPWLVIFTDKEELRPNEGIEAQGSYLLGRGLKQTLLKSAGFYVFDSCGRGDTLIISDIAETIIKEEKTDGALRMRRKLALLRERALFHAGRVFGRKYDVMPTPFSDNAGFLRAGLAAQALTVLPAREAADFAKVVRAQPAVAGALVSRERRAGLGREIALPETWNMMNSNADRMDVLTPAIFSRLVTFACVLAYHIG
jgi:hypothetical protein